MKSIEMAAALAATLVASVPAHAREPEALENVRPRDATAELLLRFGSERSPALRDLLRNLASSNVIVYIDVRQESRHPIGGGLTFLAAAGGMRLLRVVVDSGTTSRARTHADIVRLTAILGHELRHAVEASQAPSLIDEEDFERYFRGIGDEDSDVLDTLAARETGAEVERELRDGERSLLDGESSVQAAVRRPRPCSAAGT